MPSTANRLAPSQTATSSWTRTSGRVDGLPDDWDEAFALVATPAAKAEEGYSTRFVAEVWD